MGKKNVWFSNPLNCIFQSKKYMFKIDLILFKSTKNKFTH